MPRTSTQSDRSFQSFGQALRFLRKRNRLTQEELARSVGYSREQIGHLETGRRKPDPTTVAALFVPSLNLQDDMDLTSRFLKLADTARKDSLATGSDTAPTVEPPDQAEDLSKPRRSGAAARKAHREAAEVAELGRGDVVEAARQYFLAGDFKEAADVLTDQGSLLTNQGRAGEAADLIDQILSALAADPATPERADVERRLLMIRGDLLLNTARAEEAEANYRQALALATGVVRSMLIYRLASSLTQRGRPAEALEMAQAAYEELPPEHLLIRAQLKLVEGGAQMTLSRLDEAERASLEVLELADRFVLAMPLVAAGIRARANNALGAVNAIRQRSNEALAYWRAAVDTARLAGIRALEYRCQGNIATLLSEMGDLEASTTACDAAIDGLRSIGDLTATAKFTHLSANLLFFRGEIEHSLERIEEACTMKQHIGDRQGFLISLNQKLRCLLALGRSGEVADVFDQVRLEVEQLGDPRLRAYWLITQSEWQMLSGEHEAAAESVRQAMALPGIAENHKVRNDCLNHLVMALLTKADVDGAYRALSAGSDVGDMPEIELDRELIGALLEMARGDAPAAHRRAEDLAAHARRCGYLIYERRADHLRAVRTIPPYQAMAALIYGRVEGHAPEASSKA